jgi:hypothetical protein
MAKQEESMMRTTGLGLTLIVLGVGVALAQISRV